MLLKPTMRPMMPTATAKNGYIASFVPQAPEHALFKEHNSYSIEVLLLPVHVCGTACHLTYDILTLATMTSNANGKLLCSNKLQHSVL